VPLDASGAFSSPPAQLGGGSLTELLSDGRIKIAIDPKYPQAMGISTIVERAKMFGNFAWEALVNNFADSPFLTSDFPAAIEQSSDPRVLNRIVPLTPTLALRIYPDVAIDKDKCDFSFPFFRFRIRKAARQEVEYINTSIVQCAETTVFYGEDHPWVSRLVARNRHFRIEPQTIEAPTSRGGLLISTQRIAAGGAA
jgi:hypothetical protein